MQTPRNHVWNSRYIDGDDAHHAPADVLLENAHRLPLSGHALDLACGLGRNAVYLADKGFSVEAWDFSDIAIASLQRTAAELELDIDTRLIDVENGLVDCAIFDVIVVSNFLIRSIFPSIVEKLESGGLLFYQTFLRSGIDDGGPENPAYRLNPGELPALCNSLEIVFYNEIILPVQGGTGRSQALYVGRKRTAGSARRARQMKPDS